MISKHSSAVYVGILTSVLFVLSKMSEFFSFGKKIWVLLEFGVASRIPSSFIPTFGLLT